MARYRQVLAVPGMAPLLGISLLARVAVTAVAVALTMYVVLGLDMSYAAAGGVAAALTAGIALGAPLLGRMIDRWGLRAVLLATVSSQLVFWLSVRGEATGLQSSAMSAGVALGVCDRTGSRSGMSPISN